MYEMLILAIFLTLRLLDVLVDLIGDVGEILTIGLGLEGVLACYELLLIELELLA